MMTPEWRIDFSIYDAVTGQTFSDYEYLFAEDRDELFREFNLLMDVAYPEDRYEISVNRIHEDV